MSNQLINSTINNELMVQKDPQLDACLQYTYFVTDNMFHEHAILVTDFLNKLKNSKTQEWLNSRSIGEQQEYLRNQKSNI